MAGQPKQGLLMTSYKPSCQGLAKTKGSHGILFSVQYFTKITDFQGMLFRVQDLAKKTFVQRTFFSVQGLATIPDRDLYLDIPAISSLVHCESRALDHAATEAGYFDIVKIQIMLLHSYSFAGSSMIFSFAILFTYLFAIPFRRGFFCDDESIRHPHKLHPISPSSAGQPHTRLTPWTIRPLKRESLLSSQTVTYGTLESTTQETQSKVEGTSFVQIMVLESVRHGLRTPGRYRIFGKTPPQWLVQLGTLSKVFLGGAAFNQITVDVGKYCVGRLRPHFIAVCLPDVLTTCMTSTDHSYITDYLCTGADKDVIQEASASDVVFDCCAHAHIGGVGRKAGLPGRESTVALTVPALA
uniref:Uncharacterized protein n=1 Tax=Timema poppense TaxID=170557 RepID=A0A7R9HA97_TIMPO|nr:unnamed protein product [Timema poppensis]